MYDVAIVGAGPAGSAAALALRGSGLRVALLDRAGFPRDKVCGDAIPGHALQALGALDSTYVAALGALVPRQTVRRSRVVAPGGRSFVLSWKLPTFNSPRLHFDAALLGLVRQHTGTVVLERATLRTLVPTADGVVLALADGRTLAARLVLGCDGATSRVRRQLVPAPLNRAQSSAGVRAYFTEVAGATDGTTEFFFGRSLRAGYLWIFGVGDGLYNVGLGMLAAQVARYRVDLRTLLAETLASHPELAPRFAQAQQVGPTVGAGLPFGGGYWPAISGERFLLCGDAASLIDPLQGHGIDLAIRSGILAAGYAQEACAANAFGAAHLAAYDQAIRAGLGPQLRHSYRLLRVFSQFPALLSLGARLAQVPALAPWVQRLVG